MCRGVPQRHLVGSLVNDFGCPSAATVYWMRRRAHEAVVTVLTVGVLVSLLGCTGEDRGEASEQQAVRDDLEEVVAFVDRSPSYTMTTQCVDGTDMQVAADIDLPGGDSSKDLDVVSRAQRTWKTHDDFPYLRKNFGDETWGLTFGDDDIGNMTLVAARVDASCPRDGD